MPEFAGVNHLALTVTDLDASQRFYCDLLGFTLVLDLGHGRVCLHQGTGFSLALLRWPGGDGAPFSELRTGLDHLGLTAASREELVEWEQRLRAAGVPCSPVQDLPLGHHLNFRDPDGIALELQAPTAEYAAAMAQLRATPMSETELRVAAGQLLGPEVVGPLR